MNRFENRVVLITGSGGGLGKASALRFVEEGARVVIADIDLESAEAVADEIGSQAKAIKADVTSIDDCKAMVQTAQDIYGQLNVVFANAGVGGNKTEFVDMSIEEWDRVVDVNLRGMMLTCKASVPALIEAGGGALVLMGASTGGWDTILGSGPYMTSKEAVKAMGRNLALELGRYNIRVNVICPGIIQTQLSFRQGDQDPDAWKHFFGKFSDRIPLRRVGQPEDVAATVAFLASDKIPDVTGAILPVDGGWTAYGYY